MKTKIAVVGSGYWGKNLVRNFHDLNALKTICDLDEVMLNEYKLKYPEVKTTTSFQDIIEDNEIKGVVISTPAILHYKMVKEALKCGKDVFVEKPLSLDVNEGKELVKIASENKNILMVGHILHYHPAIKKLKQMINHGELGQIQYIYSNRLNLGKFRTEENILWSFAPHDISIILMLLNEMPIKISCHQGTYLNKNIPDVTMTMMEFSSAVRAHIFVSWLHPYKEQKLVVVGSKKMAVFDDVSSEKLSIYPHEIEWVNRIPVPHKKDAEIIKIEKKEPLKEECKHFLNCIKSRKSPETDGKEGLRVLEVLEKSQRSLENQGENVRIQSESYSVHPSSIIDLPCEIGVKTKIWHFSHVMAGAKIGESCNIGQNVMIGPEVIIGNNVKIQNNVSVYTGVEVEDDVFLGPSMVLTNVTNPRSFISRKNEFKKTLIKKGATIGANSTIVCGNEIGKYSLIGAGAVVTKNVPNYAIVVGNPAKKIGWICECGLKLKFTHNLATCSCGKKYEKSMDIVRIIQ
ncbi:Gfo/Idh/MocA family oxidoreductase [Methanobacterium formicicum]|uniref:Oxidoreductase domain-containing protein n=1 Tax=Methanobacterium formicicum (strain DSM 3637 / PP1) TaxID=1204725 RepID=K2QE65_METFP|nr:Gfo/Idh/MocA family oxidoreductase [Methanobacterium formicicum]EKF86371.1 oxidoreductase domain-containing protein [Methanobacterium formicicum DSM 3637]